MRIKVGTVFLVFITFTTVEGGKRKGSPDDIPSGTGSKVRIPFESDDTANQLRRTPEDDVIEQAVSTRNTRYGGTGVLFSSRTNVVGSGRENQVPIGQAEVVVSEVKHQGGEEQVQPRQEQQLLNVFDIRRKADNQDSESDPFQGDWIGREHQKAVEEENPRSEILRPEQLPIRPNEAPKSDVQPELPPNRRDDEPLPNQRTDVLPRPPDDTTSSNQHKEKVDRFFGVAFKEGETMDLERTGIPFNRRWGLGKGFYTLKAERYDENDNTWLWSSDPNTGTGVYSLPAKIDEIMKRPYPLKKEVYENVRGLYKPLKRGSGATEEWFEKDLGEDGEWVKINQVVEVDGLKLKLVEIKDLGFIWDDSPTRSKPTRRSMKSWLKQLNINGPIAKYDEPLKRGSGATEEWFEKDLGEDGQWVKINQVVEVDGLTLKLVEIKNKAFIWDNSPTTRGIVKRHSMNVWKYLKKFQDDYTEQRFESRRGGQKRKPVQHQIRNGVINFLEASESAEKDGFGGWKAVDGKWESAPSLGLELQPVKISKNSERVLYFYRRGSYVSSTPASYSAIGKTYEYFLRTEAHWSNPKPNWNFPQPPGTSERIYNLLRRGPSPEDHYGIRSLYVMHVSESNLEYKKDWHKMGVAGDVEYRRRQLELGIFGVKHEVDSEIPTKHPLLAEKVAHSLALEAGYMRSPRRGNGGTEYFMIPKDKAIEFQREAVKLVEEMDSKGYYTIAGQQAQIKN